MSIASRGCYPCSGPAGTPMGHLWTQARGCDTHTAHTEAGTLCKQTCTHTPRKPITADIIINNGGTMGSGATIANTTQSLRVFIVHEWVVSQLQCCCWDRFSSQVANSAVDSLATWDRFNMMNWVHAESKCWSRDVECSVCRLLMIKSEWLFSVLMFLVIIFH